MAYPITFQTSKSQIETTPILRFSMSSKVANGPRVIRIPRETFPDFEALLLISNKGPNPCKIEYKAACGFDPENPHVTQTETMNPSEEVVIRVVDYADLFPIKEYEQTFVDVYVLDVRARM